jgi:hypothetical protein
MMLVGCTGFVEEAEKRFLEAGCDIVWKKPMPSKYEALQQIAMKRHQRLGTSSSSSTHHHLTNKTSIRSMTTTDNSANDGDSDEESSDDESNITPSDDLDALGIELSIDEHHHYDALLLRQRQVQHDALMSAMAPWLMNDHDHGCNSSIVGLETSQSHPVISNATGNEELATSSPEELPIDLLEEK